MFLNNISNSETSNLTREDFFYGVNEHTLFKTLICFLCLFLTVVNVLLLYSIIWFEHFGSDLKRTLINKFLVSACWLGIEFEIVLHGTNMIRYAIGPFPASVCIFRTIILYSGTMNVLFFVDMNLLSRYIFIFILKNPAALIDDFW